MPVMDISFELGSSSSTLEHASTKRRGLVDGKTRGSLKEGCKKVTGKRKRSAAEVSQIDALKAKAIDDEASHSEKTKRKNISDISIVLDVKKGIDSRQTTAMILAKKKAVAFKGFGTLQIIDGQIRLVFGYRNWNSRTLDVPEAKKLYNKILNSGLLWMVFPMNIIASADEIDFSGLTQELSEGPLHEVILLEKARAHGKIDAVAGQHRKEALAMLHRHWDAQIQATEALLNAAKTKGESSVSKLELDLVNMQTEKGENKNWVVAVWDRDLVDDQLGLVLSSNEEQHRYKATELEIVNSHLFNVTRASTAEGTADAKVTLLKNCHDLRICSVLHCPEFLNFLVETYALPGLRNCATFNNPTWIKSFLPVGRQRNENSVVAGTLIHMFLVMRQLMVDISTEVVATTSTSKPAIPEIWNSYLLEQVDVIYTKTIGCCISQDGELTSVYANEWRNYRQQVANLMQSVFGDQHGILSSSTPFNRATMWMYHNVLRLLPEAITETELPWPLLTNTVMRDFTSLFTKIDGPISLYVHIVEGHWGTPTDMDPHSRERFFDGTIVLHRHMDQLLAAGTKGDSITARTQFAQHLRLKRSTSLARLRFLVEDNPLSPFSDIQDPDTVFQERWKKAKTDLNKICLRPRDDEDIVKVLLSDRTISPEISALVSSIHSIRPKTLRQKEKLLVARTKDVITNSIRIITRTERLAQSATYCDERRWFLGFLSDLAGSPFQPWDQVAASTLSPPDDNTPATLIKERAERDRLYQDKLRWKKVAGTIIKLPFAVDEDNVLLPEVYNGIQLMNQALAHNSSRRLRKLEPNIPHNKQSITQEWDVDFSSVRIPIMPNLQTVIEENMNEEMGGPYADAAFDKADTGTPLEIGPTTNSAEPSQKVEDTLAQSINEGGVSRNTFPTSQANPQAQDFPINQESPEDDRRTAPPSLIVEVPLAGSVHENAQEVQVPILHRALLSGYTGLQALGVLVHQKRLEANSYAFHPSPVAADRFADEGSQATRHTFPSTHAGLQAQDAFASQKRPEGYSYSPSPSPAVEVPLAQSVDEGEQLTMSRDMSYLDFGYASPEPFTVSHEDVNMPGQEENSSPQADVADTGLLVGHPARNEGHSLDIQLYTQSCLDALASINQVILHETPDSTYLPTMTVLCIEIADWFTELDELEPLRPAVAFLRRQIAEDYKYPQFARLFDHGADTYGNFHDPLHMRIVTAILMAANKLVSPPLQTQDIVGFLKIRSNPQFRVSQMIFMEFPLAKPTSAEKGKCVFDSAYCSQIHKQMEITRLRILSAKPTKDEPGSGSMALPKPRKVRVHKGPTVTHRAGLSNSLIDFKKEMAQDSLQRERADKLKNKRVRGPEN